MSGWIGQSNPTGPSIGTVHADKLRQSLGGGTVHVRAENKAAAIKTAATMLGVPEHQVTVVPYESPAWSQVEGQ